MKYMLMNVKTHSQYYQIITNKVYIGYYYTKVKKLCNDNVYK